MVSHTHPPAARSGVPQRPCRAAPTVIDTGAGDPPRPRAAAARRPVVRAALFLAVAILGAYQVGALADPGDLRTAAMAFTAGWLLCVALLARRDRGGIYAPGAAYLATYGLFHGGLLLSFLLRGEAGLAGVEIGWFLGSSAPVAAALASLGMIVFAVSADLTTAGSAPALPRAAEPAERRVLAVLGLGTQLTGLVLFLGAVLTGGGLGLLVSGYATFLDAVQGDSLLPLAVLALSVGPPLTVAAGGRARLLSWAMFATYAAFAFPLGLRGEVLFPLVAMLVVEVRRGRRIRPLWTIGGAVAVMTLIGMVRRTRAEGVSALFDLDSLASPLDAVAEMGYSLRPTVVVLDWQARGEPLRYGETLLIVPIRAMEKLLGGGAPAFDMRIFNTELLARVGPIGASPVAEAQHNFGTAGVVAGLALLGVLIGLLSGTVRTPWTDALLGALLVVLLINVRNSFAPVPLQVVLIVGMLGTARILARANDQRPRRGHGARR